MSGNRLHSERAPGGTENFLKLIKPFSGWNGAPFCWLHLSFSAKLLLMRLLSPAAKGWESNLRAAGNFTGKMQTANLRLCLEIFSVFPAAARNQVGGRNPNRNSLSLFSATHFPTPSKANPSYKTGGSCRFALQLSPLPHSEAFVPSFLACPVSPSTLLQSHPPAAAKLLILTLQDQKSSAPVQFILLGPWLCFLLPL